MKKKYFPSPSKQNTRKVTFPNKTIARRLVIKDAKKGKSLRKEFDLIINKDYTMLTSREVDMVWLIIGTYLAHNITHTGTLKHLIKDTIRLINNSHTNI